MAEGKASANLDCGIGRNDVVDRGLQIERTRLAWKRTLLNMTVFTLLVLRILPEIYAFTGLLVGLSASAVTIVAMAAYHLRAGRYVVWFVRTDHAQGGKAADAIGAPPKTAFGGGPLLALALGIAVCAVLCAACIIES